MEDGAGQGCSLAGSSQGRRPCWCDWLLSRCQVVRIDEPLHAFGEARCRQARIPGLSFPDGMSIEVMRRRGIREAIARDEHFAREGFVLP